MTVPPPPGLQAERTDLAWERTGLGALGTAVLLAARAPGATTADLLPAAVALLLALTLIAIGRHRGRGVCLAGRTPAAAPVGIVLVAGGGTAALGVLVLVLSLVD